MSKSHGNVFKMREKERATAAAEEEEERCARDELSELELGIFSGGKKSGERARVERVRAHGRTNGPTSGPRESGKNENVLKAAED